MIYVERTPDSNQKWYILFFDPNQNGWGFSYTGSPKPEPGMFLRRQHPSHPMLDKTVTPLDTERSGESSNFIVNMFDSLCYGLKFLGVDHR